MQKHLQKAAVTTPGQRAKDCPCGTSAGKPSCEKASEKGCIFIADEPVKGPASYFPSIEKKYGRPIAEWQEIVRNAMPAKHMELVAMLKTDHGMGHGHANALVAHTLASPNG